ncbi:MAG: PHP domain-containing protein [Chloroflexota bacterium]|nr:PHP domain-containing protein [Chloroflexota bacterium]
MIGQNKDLSSIPLRTDIHIHSSFSDGLNTPEELVLEAIRLGYQEIAITDHVRRSTHWLDGFHREMERLKKLYADRIDLYSGIEAKVINLQGDIDAHPNFCKMVDIVLGAFHRLPIGGDKYWSSEDIMRDQQTALQYWVTSITNLMNNQAITVLAHPTAILKRNKIYLQPHLKEAIANHASTNGKVFELNVKYGVPDNEFISILKNHNVQLIPGSDSHSMKEMEETKEFLEHQSHLHHSHVITLADLTYDGKS